MRRLLGALLMIALLSGCVKAPEPKMAGRGIEENRTVEKNQTLVKGGVEELKSRIRTEILEALERSNESES